MTLKRLLEVLPQATNIVITKTGEADITTTPANVKLVDKTLYERQVTQVTIVTGVLNIVTS